MPNPPALLDIDLDALAANFRALDAMHPGRTAGVIKADAYGLGAAYVAPKLFDAGCRHFFTAHLAEALAVRHLVPGAVFSVLHGIAPGEAPEFSAADITPVLCSLPDVAAWRAEAARLGKTLPALLHVGTGMARLGLTEAELAALDLTGIHVTHLMTHLISAEAPQDDTNAIQLARFHAAKALFPDAGTSIANSSGIFLGPAFTANLARPGAALYGVNPTPGRENPMRPVVRLSARILQIQHLQPGETVGYNATWTAGRPSRIAVCAVGYADGYLRSLSNRGSARFDGVAVPLVGRVSMDLTTFDITDSAANEGDWLELLGPGHGVDDAAIEAGTNGYEILTSLGRRYARRYAGAVST